MDLEDIYAEGVDAVEEILSKALRYEVRKTLNPLHLPDFEKLSRSIAKSLKGHAAPVEDKALKLAMNGLDAKWTDMTPAATGKLLGEAYKYIGKPVANAVVPKVVQTLKFAGKDIIASTKKNTTLTYDLKIGPDLALTDDRILTACVVSQGHYVTDAYGKRAELAALQAKGLVAAGLSQGLGSAEISDNLRAQLASQVQGRGRGYWDIVAGVFANRARTVTQLAAFRTAGIKQYTWESVLDEATSVQCRFMHGRTFNVGSAMMRFDQVEAASASDPEAIEKIQPFLSAGRNLITGDPSLCYTGSDGSRQYAARVTENAVGQKDKVGSFDKEHSNEDLAAAGITCPPIHGRCRSTIIPGDEIGGTVSPAPPEPGEPPPKLTSGQAKAKAMQLLEIAQTMGDPEYLNPDHIFAQTAVNNDPPHLEHPFFSGTDAPGWGPDWAVNAKSKKPKIDDLIPTAPDVLASEVKGFIQKPKSLDAAAAPKVVQLDGKMYVISGHEQLAAQKLLGQKVAYCDVVNLDKKLNPVPLVHPVEPPPAESALGHVIQPKEPATPPAPPFVPALAHPSAPIPGDVILGTKTGGPEGSNEGGFYTGTDGVKRYVKFYKDPAQAEGENLANMIYRDMGHGAPVSHVFEHEGNKAYASDIVAGVRTLKDVGLTPERAREAMKGFVADVLVGNWDAAGMTFDNMVVTPSGEIMRIDNGGSFLMRAKAGRKPDSVLDQISEWDRFFDPSSNPAYSKLAKAAGISGPEDMKDLVLSEIKKVRAIADAHGGGWAGYVNKIAPGLKYDDRTKITRMLDDRMMLLEAKASVLGRPTPELPKLALRPGEVNVIGFEGAQGRALLRKLKDKDNVPHVKTLYNQAKLSRIDQENASQTVSRWTGEYKEGDTHGKMYSAAQHVIGRSKKDPDAYAASMKQVCATRQQRWRAMLDSVGMEGTPTPTHFDARRGIKGADYVEDVAKAWKDDKVTHVNLRSYELASWSFSNEKAEDFASGTGVVAKWKCPIENTMLDQFVDDNSFSQTFMSEHEIIAGTGDRKGVNLPKEEQVVRLDGRSYTYGERAALFEAMRRNGLKL